MKKYLFLILAGAVLFSAKVVIESSLLSNIELLKYVLVALAVLLVINWVAERSSRNINWPHLSPFTTYEVSYEWNYSKPIAVLTPLGGESRALIEYPSHIPPPGFRKVASPFLGKIFWVPMQK